jgi:hypothetical protein|tara:strand:+ start:357 stop:791 length:435 start_codon:yes stop_codon:yes gene_type:complete
MNEETVLENVQQIRFGNGTEVLANISNWDDGEFIEANCMLEIERRSYDMDFEAEEGKSFYVLKPWVSYIDDMYKITSVNPSSIVSVTTPSPIVVEQYTTSLIEIIKYMDETSQKETPTKTAVSPDSHNVVQFTPKSSVQLLTED